MKNYVKMAKYMSTLKIQCMHSMQYYFTSMHYYFTS